MAPTGATFVPGTTIVSGDDFATRNEFHGGDFGLQTQLAWRSLSVNLLTKLAVGNLHRSVNILGSTTTTVPGAAPVTAAGGPYTPPSKTRHNPTPHPAGLPDVRRRGGSPPRPPP